MKFNRVALIEIVRKRIELGEAKYESEIALWDEALAAWQKKVVDSQQRQLTEIIGKLQGLQGLTRPLTNKDLAVVSDGRYRDSELDELVENEPRELYYLNNDHALHRKPQPYDKTVDEQLIAVLELSVDEFVTTNGLSEMGFRNISWLWT